MPSTQKNKEVVFVLNNVEGWEYISAQTTDSIAVHILDARENAINQMVEYLKNETSADAIHFIGHADAGRMDIGNSWLSNETIGTHQASLEQLGSMLKPGADIFLYGCNLGAGVEGKLLIDQLAMLTKADIAASNDITGTSPQGGDWHMEIQSGQITTKSLAYDLPQALASFSLDSLLQSAKESTMLLGTALSIPLTTVGSIGTKLAKETIDVGALVLEIIKFPDNTWQYYKTGEWDATGLNFFRDISDKLVKFDETLQLSTANAWLVPAIMAESGSLPDGVTIENIKAGLYQNYSQFKESDPLTATVMNSSNELTALVASLGSGLTKKALGESLSSIKQGYVDTAKDFYGSVTSAWKEASELEKGKFVKKYWDSWAGTAMDMIQHYKFKNIEITRGKDAYTPEIMKSLGISQEWVDKGAALLSSLGDIYEGGVKVTLTAVMRVANPESLKWIEKGHISKVMDIKSKTMKDIDFFLNPAFSNKNISIETFKKDFKGLVGAYDPTPITDDIIKKYYDHIGGTSSKELAGLSETDALIKVKWILKDRAENTQKYTNEFKTDKDNKLANYTIDEFGRISGKDEVFGLLSDGSPRYVTGDYDNYTVIGRDDAGNEIKLSAETYQKIMDAFRADNSGLNGQALFLHGGVQEFISDLLKGNFQAKLDQITEASGGNDKFGLFEINSKGEVFGANSSKNNIGIATDLVQHATKLQLAEELVTEDDTNTSSNDSSGLVPVVWINDAIVQEKTGDISTAKTVVHLSKTFSQDTIIKYIITDISTKGGVDYHIPTEQYITIKAGEKNGYIPIQIIDDNEIEPLEKLKITLTEVINGRWVSETNTTGQSATITVLSNDFDPNDITPPNIVSASTNQSTLFLHFSEGLSNYTPSHTQLTITINGVNLPISSIDVDNNTLKIGVSTTIHPTDNIRVGYVDDSGNDLWAIQDFSGNDAGTFSITQFNRLPTGTIKINGTPTEKETLSITSTLADFNGMGAISYQWLREGSAISGATASSYTLTQSDVGQSISVRATYTDGSRTVETVTSETTSPVQAAGVNTLPFFGNTQPGIGAIYADIDRITTTELQPDGKIIIGGQINNQGNNLDFALVRLNKNGSIDNSFGANGRAIIDIENSSNDFATSLTIQPDGKMVLGGYSITLRDGTYTSDYSIVRLNSNGSLDNSFNSNGKSIVNVKGAADYATRLLLQPDGKLILSGHSGNSFSQISSSPNWFASFDDYNYIYGSEVLADSFDFSAVRLNNNGSLDSGFGTNGKVVIPLSSRSDVITGMAMQTDGKLILSGSGNHGKAFAAVRLNADGSLDNEFLKTKAVMFDKDNFMPGKSGSLAIQTDGKLILGGVYGKLITLIRLNTDGSPDTSFSDDSVEIINTATYNNWVSSLAIQSDGKILLAGFMDIYTSAFNQARHAMLIRINANGGLDKNFGTDGMLIFNSKGNDHISDMVIQSDGKILLSGNWGTSAVFRINSDGSLDTTFGSTVVGSSLSDVVTYIENAAPIILDSSVQITDAELSALNSGAGNYAGASITLERHGGASVQDVFSGSGALSFIGNSAVLSGVVIGNVSNSGGKLLITFNSNATQAKVNAALSAVAYKNISDAPPPSVQIDWSFTDRSGSGALSVTDKTTVNITNVNDAPTGAVTITGTAKQGQMLSAANTLADADGLGTIAYQWLANGTAITGATASTFTLTKAQVGKTISVKASYTDGQGTAESKTSTVTGAVTTDADPILLGIDSVNALILGGTVSDSIPNNGADWFVCNLSAGQSIDIHMIGDPLLQAAGFGGFDTYLELYDASGKLLSSDDNSGGGYDAYITFTAPTKGNYYVKARGFGDYDYGDYDLVSTSLFTNTSPTGDVTITGTATQGQVLTATHTLADADGLGAISYQWLANGTAITGATASTLTLAQAQVGKAISVRASYTDGQGTAESKTSSATLAVTNVNDAPTGAVTITGTATQGQVLTATHTLADADGLGAISYQWLANGSAISGATASSLTLTQALVGKAISVKASYADGAGTRETITSAAVTAVQAPVMRTGSTFIDVGSMNLPDISTNALIQPDGKLVAVGVTDLFIPGVSPIRSDRDFSVVRLNSDGSLDNSFSGDGKAVIDLNGVPNHALSVAIQSDGKLIIAGVSVRDQSDFSVIRLNANGSLDTTFGNTGKAVFDASGSSDSDGIQCVVIQPDGKLVLAGYSFGMNMMDFCLMRLNTDGSLDNTFNLNGKIIFDLFGTFEYPMTVFTQPDGKLVVAGWSSMGGGYGLTQNIVAARLNADGSLDQTFGNGDGKIVIDNGYKGEGNKLIGMALPNGKLILTSYSLDNSSKYDIGTVQLNANGSLHSISRDEGYLPVNLTETSSSNFHVTFQIDGKLVLVGNKAGDFAITRLNNNFSLDRSFGDLAENITAYARATTPTPLEASTLASEANAPTAQTIDLVGITPLSTTGSDFML